MELVPDPDYAQWRVDIKVKFRDNEKLQLLTGQRQSGGVGCLFEYQIIAAADLYML